MSIINYTTKEKELLARLMRAEALGEGDLGMLMVGNVIINRIIGDCLTFKKIRSPTTKELQLADRILRGEYYHPATNALWFYAPKKGATCLALWYDQRNSGRYKSHCFYIPYEGVCRQIH